MAAVESVDDHSAYLEASGAGRCLVLSLLSYASSLALNDITQLLYSGELRDAQSLLLSSWTMQDRIVVLISCIFHFWSITAYFFFWWHSILLSWGLPYLQNALSSVLFIYVEPILRLLSLCVWTLSSTDHMYALPPHPTINPRRSSARGGQRSLGRAPAGAHVAQFRGAAFRGQSGATASPGEKLRRNWKGWLRLVLS